MKNYIIDSHAHLDHERFDEDRQEIIDSFEEDRVLLMINPASDLASSRAALDLAKSNERIYALVGTHPHEAKYYDQATRQEYKKMAQEEKVVGIGEIGLDYYYEFSDREVQKKVFIDQINLAKELGLPIVIHSRDAVEDTYQILFEHAQGMKVLLHAFSESWEVAQRYLDLGFFISMGGVVTFKNANKLLRVGENVPLDRLVLETDSPYLTPTPYRGKRNQPAYTHYVADKLGELKDMDSNEIRQASLENTLEFFGIKL